MAGPAAAASQAAEPAARAVLRVGFSLLWLADGLLQAQPSMAVGLPSAALSLGFGLAVAAHGFAVNLAAVATLAVLGVALAAAAVAGPGGWPARRPAVLRAVVIGLGVLCAADWLLVQDLGVFGGLGTDPNSMIPMILIAVAGSLALTRGAATAAESAVAAGPTA